MLVGLINGHTGGQESHLLGITYQGMSFSCILMDSGSVSVTEENILVILKVHVSISTKLTRRRLGRRMDFPSDGYGVDPLPPALPGNTDVPPNGIWGQLECFCWGAGSGPQV